MQFLILGTAWSDCALNYHCAIGIIKGYISGVGRVNSKAKFIFRFIFKYWICFRIVIMMEKRIVWIMQYNGGWGCEKQLNREENSQKYLRFHTCMSSNS